MKQENPIDLELSRVAARAAAGDARATEQLFSLLLPRVRNLVRYLVRGDRDVDDFSQDALVTIYKGLGSYRGEGPFRAWADRVTARSVFAALKQRTVTPTEQPDRSPSEPLDEGTSPDGYVLRRQLVTLLDALPEEQRQALVLHHVLGMTVPEIASELEVSGETVRSRLRLGKDRMRLGMNPHEPSAAAGGTP